jgi:adenylate cyclase
MARDQRRLTAIVSADVAGYSRLIGRDESDTLAALKVPAVVVAGVLRGLIGARVTRRHG